ncbi:MAG TPA: prepilin-type N-terminal cleavage/methylation domain-containing protein [Verrucomicrobiae bacterium]|jgi:prepilin-type N-terminal cleavage/methylation domain-containing protein
MNFVNQHAGFQQSGFSLVEVMIAIVILGVVLVGLTQGISTALSSSKESEWQTTGALFAAGQIEALRAAKDLTDGETSGTCGAALPQYSWQQTISPTDVDGLHSVAVTVARTQSGTVIYELKTLLFEPTDSTNSQTNGKDKTP